MDKSLQKQKNVCLIHPSKHAYSETFIHKHIEHLPASMTVLYGQNMLEGGLMIADPIEGDKQVVPAYLRGVTRLLPKGYSSFNGDRIYRKELDSISSLALRRFLRFRKVNAVLAEYGTTGVAVMESCLKVGVPLIVHFHGFDAHSDRVVEPYASSYQRMFASAHALVVVSHSMEKKLLQMGAPPQKVYRNVYGVDCTQFKETHPDKNEPLFITVGRFVDKKAPQLSLLAFRKVLTKCPSARLSMVADGPLLESCKQMVHVLGMEHAVHFTGPVDHGGVAQALQKARAFIQHSVTTSYGDTEGTPLSILEAGASGLPVVSTRHAGIRDVVIEEKTGFLVDEFDVEGMAKQMIALVEQPERALALGRNARKHIEDNFSLEESINNLWGIILNCIKEG